MNLVLHWPWFLALLPLPWLAYQFLPEIKQQSASLRLPTYMALGESDTTISAKSSSGKYVLLSIVWLLMLLASSRPIWIGEEVQLPATGRDLLLAVDISGSMKTEDMLVNGDQTPRIAVVKQVVNDFVKQRSGDRLGLVLFGTHAYLHVPLSFDRAVIQQQLSETQLGFAGMDTAIGDAIAIAVKKLRDRPQESRVVVLLTDGKNTTGQIDPRQAADLAKIADIKIHTIGVGADSMMVRDLFFSRQINPSAELDEATLTYIAETTGGQYFRARSPEDLQKIYSIIDQLEPIEQEAETFRPRKELFFWPLSAALTLILVWCGIALRYEILSWFTPRRAR